MSRAHTAANGLTVNKLHVRSRDRNNVMYLLLIKDSIVEGALTLAVSPHAGRAP